MRRVEFRLLGPVEVATKEGPVALGRRQQRELLAILLVNLNTVVSTDRLIELLWPDKPPGRPQTAIQGYISGLRKLLGHDTIETTGGGYVLRAEPDQLDTTRFEQLRLEAERALVDGNPSRAAWLLGTALALWRGPAIADFVYESWAQDERGRLEELRLLVHERLFDARLALGEHGQLIGDIEAVMSEQPLRERLRAQLMLALYRSGRQAEALDAYQRARERLRDELGIDPSPELQTLYKQILNQDQGLQLHLGAERPRDSVPTPPNRLIGRDRELEELRWLLRRDEVRLITLTGPGGVGKTRLAQRVARDLSDEFADGVVYVNLAPIKDPELVAATTAVTLNVLEESSRPLGHTLAESLRGKRMLLFFDNFEHLLPAVGVVSDLLADGASVKVLATSRVPLHLAGERLYPVDPLSIPDVSDVSRDSAQNGSAFTLFVERAIEADSRFELTDENASAVVEICRKLDGLPLAVELAAARVAVFSPHALLRRLSAQLEFLKSRAHEVDERHQTLVEAMRWSYGLLPPDEQMLFRRLGIFIGGCRIEAVDGVLNNRGELEIDVLDGLQSLVEKSLLRRRDDPDQEPRFWMLETIHAFAAELLRSDPSGPAVAARHAAYFLKFAEATNPVVEGGGPDQADALAHLESDHANLIAAEKYYAAAGDSGRVVRLSTALAYFRIARDYPSPLFEPLHSALADAGAAPLRVRVRAVRFAAEASRAAGEVDRVLAYSDEALRLAYATEDPIQIGRARFLHVNERALVSGAFTKRSVQELADALQLLRAANDPYISAYFGNFGYHALCAGELDLAESAINEVLSFARERDDIVLQGTLANLAWIKFARGDETGATSFASEAAELALRLHHQASYWEIYMLFAYLSTQKEPERAAELLGGAATLLPPGAHLREPYGHRQYVSAERQLTQLLGRAAFQQAHGRGKSAVGDDAEQWLRTLIAHTSVA